MTIADEIAALPPWSLADYSRAEFYTARLALAERLLRQYEVACDHSSPREMLEICAEQTRLYLAKREAE